MRTGVWQLDNYRLGLASFFSSNTLFPPAAEALIMSSENPDELVSRSELSALVDAAVARALSSRTDPGGVGELFRCPVRVGFGIRSIGGGKRGTGR